MTVELPILGLLRERPMHGYELRQATDAVLGHLGPVSWGSLYPMLGKLVRAGHLSQMAEQPARGPARVVHAITPSGERRLRQLLLSAPAARPAAATDGREVRQALLVKLAFFHYLDRPERRQVLRDHAAALQVRLALLLAPGSPPVRSQGRYRQAILNHVIAGLRADLQWLEWLQRTEGDPDPGV